MKDIVKDATEAAVCLKSMGCKLPLITIGDKGAIFISKENSTPVHISLEPVAAVDTTVSIIFNSSEYVEMYISSSKNLLLEGILSSF